MRGLDQSGSYACHTVSCLLSSMPQIYPAVYVRIDAASGAACGNRLPQSLNSNPTKLALFFSLHPQTYTINKEKKNCKIPGEARF